MSNSWDSRFGADSYLYGTEANDFLRAEGHRFPPGPILSLGEGEGRNAVFLAALGHPMTAVDGSAVGLEKARRLAADRGVGLETVHADLTTFDLGIDRWSGILSIWCHLPSATRRTVHAGIARALKPGGILMMEHYHPRQLEFRTGGPPDVNFLLTLEELRAAFPGWREIHALEGERTVQEGPLHNGRSFVTQWIAQRPG